MVRIKVFISSFNTIFCLYSQYMEYRTVTLIFIIKHKTRSFEQHHTKPIRKFEYKAYNSEEILIPISPAVFQPSYQRPTIH